MIPTKLFVEEKIKKGKEIGFFKKTAFHDVQV